MPAVTRHYNVVNRTNFDADLPTIQVPGGIQHVDKIYFVIDTRNASGVITFNDAVNEHLTLIGYKSLDGGETWLELFRIEVDGGGVDRSGNPVDPSGEYMCDPPIPGGSQFKMHITQVGTYRLGGDLSADYTA